MCKRGYNSPVFLCQSREYSRRLIVDVDSCIASFVQQMNDKGIHTLGCCCGHGERNGSIIYEIDKIEYELELEGNESNWTEMLNNDLLKHFEEGIW